MSSSKFSAVLRKVRLDKNLSQERLAELSNLDPVTIYRYENSIQEPSLHNLFSLCKGLGISVSDFTIFLEQEGYPEI